MVKVTPSNCSAAHNIDSKEVAIVSYLIGLVAFMGAGHSLKARSGINRRYLAKKYKKIAFVSI